MRVMFRLVLLGLFLIGTFACSANEDKSCKDSDGCVAGETCCIETGKTEGTCKAKEDCKQTSCKGTACKTKDDCKNNETCSDGCCTSNTTCDTACKSNTDCKNNETCVSGCCQASGGNCAKADDCPEGQECIGAAGNGVCQACSQTCSSALDCTVKGHDCYRGCCRRPPCKDNTGCDSTSSKRYCDTKSGQCVTCLVNKDCEESRNICDPKTFTCRKVECTDTADCPNEKPECNPKTYKCEEKPVCREDADCTDRQLNRCDPKGKGTCKKGNCIPCNNDDECGTNKDFCVKVSQGLKDGAKCLIGCEKNSDCPSGFDCEEKVGDNFIVGKGISVCFPRIKYCTNPCSPGKCNSATEFCNLEKGGICELLPAPCKPCTGDAECNKPNETGNKCLELSGKKFCGKACSSDADCPTNQKTSSGSQRDFKCVGGQCTALDSCQ